MHLKRFCIVSQCIRCTFYTLCMHMSMCVVPRIATPFEFETICHSRHIGDKSLVCASTWPPPPNARTYHSHARLHARLQCIQIYTEFADWGQ